MEGEIDGEEVQPGSEEGEEQCGGWEAELGSQRDVSAIGASNDCRRECVVQNIMGGDIIHEYLSAISFRGNLPSALSARQPAPHSAIRLGE